MFISQVDSPCPATAVDKSTLNLSPTRGNDYDATTSMQQKDSTSELPMTAVNRIINSNEFTIKGAPIGNRMSLIPPVAKI